MSEQLKKFKLKWVKYEGWDWVGDDPCDQFENEFEFVRAQDADALAERLRECEAALGVYKAEEFHDAHFGQALSVLMAKEIFDYGKTAREYFQKWGEK